ncbi:MAG: Gfo/Idh/MocA family oxidoreductase [Acidobacteria bacterium]|nr:Gfo/Idh/MocA family oxidoreductase [Acidobacteriota bacterium]
MAEVTRREALQTAAAAMAAGLGACGGSGPAGSTAVSRKDDVPYALIGAGDRGSFLLKRLAGTSGGRCVGICDTYEPNLKNALQFAPQGVKQYRDHREALDDKEVRAVIIATPLFRHFDVTRDALLAGKHAFCEKSLVFHAGEVHALRALSESRPGQVLQTGLQRRYSPLYQAARQMIEKGLLGDVMHIRAQWHRNGAGRRPVKDPSLEEQINWRLYKDYSAGPAAELASHQMDVADWMFGATPEFVTGVGGIDYWKDGRETYDNIHLIFRYPKGQKLVYTSISYNGHCDLLYGRRPNFGEEICGTAGTLHITIGDAANPAVGPAMALWFREPNAPKAAAGNKGENWVAGATVSTEKMTSKGFPLLLPKDVVQNSDSFVEKELKFARQWLYKHDIVAPEEDRNPVDLSLEDFFRCVRTGARPKADLEVGLADSTGVILSNLAMEEGRRVEYGEIGKLGRGALS